MEFITGITCVRYVPAMPAGAKVPKDKAHRVNAISIHLFPGHSFNRYCPKITTALKDKLSEPFFCLMFLVLHFRHGQRLATMPKAHGSSPCFDHFPFYQL